MGSSSDGILSIPIRFMHESLGLSPNQISWAGFVVGIAGAGLVASGSLMAGLIVMAVSQILDGLDGGVARRYNLISPRGKTLEIVFDRLNELAMFLALARAGYVTMGMVALAFTAILLVTIGEHYSGFDPGFKRFMLYFGYLATVLFGIRGFQLAMHVIFIANLTGFAAGTIMADYRLQKAVDDQAILRRSMEDAAGVTRQPDDPPSFLSKLFS